MSNALQRLIDLLPTAAEFVGTITSVDHPNYKVLVVGGSGLNLVTSSTRYNLGASVFVSDGEIKRLAPLGEVIQIEVGCTRRVETNIMELLSRDHAGHS